MEDNKKTKMKQKKLEIELPKQYAQIWGEVMKYIGKVDKAELLLEMISKIDWFDQLF